MITKFGKNEVSGESMARHECREGLYYNIRVFDLGSVSRDNRCLPYNQSLKDPHAKRVAGYVYDISVEGVRLFTEEPVGKGDIRRFRIDLPRWPSLDSQSGSVRSIVFEARFVWATEGDGSSFCECGFQFVKLDAITRALISELIKNCHR